MPLHIETLVCGPLGNDVYVVSDGEHAIVVDAPLECLSPVQEVLRERKLTLDLIVLTHQHWDHVAEAHLLAQATSAPLAAHTLDAAALAKPRTSRLMPGVELPPLEVSRELNEGDTVVVGDTRLEVLHTPGHTQGSICLYSADDATLLSGDTLFAGSYGRVDLPGSDARQMADSLRRLSALPPQTRVLPGHGAETTIAQETWLRRMPPIG
jgi:glyoxylase-like metal-dependent hydrolase (beta-lactamase superfamily II)